MFLFDSSPEKSDNKQTATGAAVELNSQQSEYEYNKIKRKETNKEDERLKELAKKYKSEVSKLSYEACEEYIKEWLKDHQYSKKRTIEELEKLGINPEFIKKALPKKNWGKKAYNMVLKILHTLDRPDIYDETTKDLIIKQMVYEGYSKDAAEEAYDKIIKDLEEKKIEADWKW